MQDCENEIKHFILQRIPFFAYEKYYKSYFDGKSETPLSVWVSVVVDDWNNFQEKNKATGPLAKKMDQFCSMLEKFSLNFKEIYEMNRRTTLRRDDWAKIVKFAQDIFK